MNDNLLNLSNLNTNTNTIAATTSSQVRLMPTDVTGISVVFYNDGPGLAFVSWSANQTLVALTPSLSTNAGTAGSTPIPVGQSVPFQICPGDGYWACISLSTSNVYCTRGDGR